MHIRSNSTSLLVSPAAHSPVPPHLREAAVVGLRQVDPRAAVLKRVQPAVTLLAVQIRDFVVGDGQAGWEFCLWKE